MNRSWNRLARGAAGWALAAAMASTCAAATPASSLGPAQYLTVRDNEVVDRTGRAVRLRGVNLGGWLVTEGWMCGQSDSRERWAWEQLEERFGIEQAGVLMKAWFDHWITEDDLDVVRRWGFNTIRVPFSYRTLQHADGSWRRTPDGQVDFARLDWIVREAGRRGLYVIPVFHIWRGQRASYGAISRDEPSGAEERKEAAALWREVARHFRGNPAIAGFDLINEPEGSPGDALARTLYEAVRDGDPHRMVICESMDYANLADPSWKNVMWSGHYPCGIDDAETPVENQVAQWEQQNGLVGHKKAPAPVFIGEMKAPADNARAARDLVRAMERRSWHWAVWTYKAVDAGGWAAFNYPEAMKHNLAEDSYRTLLNEWAHGLEQGRRAARPGSRYWNAWWIEGFTDRDAWR